MTTAPARATDVAAPDATAARRLAHQLHTLVDEQTFAYITGLSALNAEKEGINPKQGETVRDLLDAAIVAAHEADPKAYAKAVRKGRLILAARKRPAA